METVGSLAAMFATALGAATLLPAQSEILFVGLQTRGTVPVWTILTVASIGNILGSVVNYLMGIYLERFRDKRWFIVTDKQLDRAQVWYQKYGYWSLLLSWAPFGDAITVVAGVLRTPFWIFLALVSVAKIARYAILAAVTAGIIG